MAVQVRTKILILSDTHGMDIPAEINLREPVDVVIHCGDLTETSSLVEYKNTLQLLRKINAPLKLFIAGNHDLSLDPPALRRKVKEAERLSNESFESSINKELDEIQSLIEEAKAEKTLYLEEGSHQFVLDNGALMKIYASPFTPSTEGWAFEYSTHDFNIDSGIDIVITHGPPRGVMDISGGKRIGCPQLFRAVAHSQPKIHCFGHVHQGWGAKLIAWKEHLSKTPNHLEDIVNSKSVVLENIGNRHEPEEVAEARKARLTQYKAQGHCRTSHCADDVDPLKDRTLFINAANKGGDELDQVPWLVEIDLPAAQWPNAVSSTPASSADCGERRSRKRGLEPECAEAKENKRARISIK
ncbi:calcineurin-like phosphoesterase [Colletotrichum falcatum]|nr:calcineurin-like phosphoesterase [Colletotrichum falcatum]